MTPHERAIEEAKHDAKQAVDQLIDAIGRIMLATLEQHQAQTPPPPNSPWTPAEDELLRQHYPQLGSKGVQTAGVRRSRQSITQRANDLHVRYDGLFTPQIDDLIRAHYPRGGVQAVREAGATGLTATQISRRAHTLGVKRIKTLPKPEPSPSPTAMALNRVLHYLLTADAQDMPLDAQDLTPHDKKCLRELEQRNLAKSLGDHLWAPTLAAIAQQAERSAA